MDFLLKLVLTMVRIYQTHYFLKESDLIPDKTPEVGLADDFAIFKQVFARNRLEIDNVIYKSQ